MAAFTKQEPDKFVLKIRSDPRLIDAVAKACNIKRQSIWSWPRVPPERVLIVARLIGYKPADIRPDVFGKEALRRR